MEDKTEKRCQYSRLRDLQPSHVSGIERRIIARLLDDILTAGYAVRINDGIEWAHEEPTRAVRDLACEIAATGETGIWVYDFDVEHRHFNRVGVFVLYHGNEAHVVSDHTDNEVCKRLVAGADALATEFGA